MGSQGGFVPAVPSTPVTTEAAPNVTQNNVITTQPIHTLPVESLASIFIHCLHPSSHSYKKQPTDSIIPRRIPIILASVCSRWRGVACNTSDLWSTCWLRYDRPELHSLWLDRAGTRPIHLNGLILPTPENARPTDRQPSLIGLLFRTLPSSSEQQIYACALTPFLTSILPYVKQWASFIVYTDVFAMRMEYALPENQFNAPQLELFHTLAAEDPDQSGRADMSYWSRAILQQAPRLRHVKAWENVPTGNNIRVKLYLCTNLVSVQLRDSPRLWYILELLRNAPMLQSLKICGFIHDSYPKNDSLPLLPVHHSCLAELRISNFHDCEDLPLLLDSLTLPALRSFDFRYYLGLLLSLRPVLRLFERSNSSLQNLYLCYDSTADLMSILRCNAVGPSLRGLFLERSNPADEMIRFLTNNSDTTNLPRLRKLTFSNVGLGDDLGSSIFEMVLSRRQQLDACEKLQYFGYTRPREGPYDQYEADVHRLSAYAESTTRESTPLVVRFGDRPHPDDDGHSEEDF